jgi:hypothetical protein
MLASISLFICKYLGACLVYVGEMVRALTRSYFFETLILVVL